MTNIGRFQNIKKRFTSCLNYCKMGLRKCVDGFNYCKRAYRGSYLGKKAKSRNLFRAIVQNALLSYFILLLCQFIFLLTNYNEYASVLEKENW